MEHVTAENKSNYGIHEVVMPLPGHDVLLPENRGKENHLIIDRDSPLVISDIGKNCFLVASVHIFFYGV